MTIRARPAQGAYEELIDAGDKVISLVTRHAQGRASGVEVERPFALVWTIRKGKVVRVVWFLTREEAFEAAGLSEVLTPMVWTFREGKIWRNTASASRAEALDAAGLPSP